MEITSALVGGGANVEMHEKRRGRTAFHCACVGGNKKIVVYLSQTVKCRIGKCMHAQGKVLMSMQWESWIFNTIPILNVWLHLQTS